MVKSEALNQVCDMLKVALKTSEREKLPDIMIYLIGMAVVEAEYQASIVPRTKARPQ